MKRMRFYDKTSLFLVFGIIFTIGFGCKNFRLKDYVEKAEEPTKTAITKENLTERMTARLVKMTEPIKKQSSAGSTTDAKKVDINEDLTSNLKPNPLMLQVRFLNGNNSFLLNGETMENFGKLANLLKEIFREREANGIFIEGTNEVYKKITLPAYENLIDEYNSKNIYVEDFEKFVDDLRNSGFDQIELDINEENYKMLPPDALINGEKAARRKLSNNSETEPKKSVDGKTISGGVLNGKAVSLPKPAYPSAARAVRASGAVNVQVTVDESGEVIEAEAAGGHPLLRAAAVEAARSAKFNPTLLSGKAVRVSGILVYNFAP